MGSTLSVKAIWLFDDGKAGTGMSKYYYNAIDVYGSSNGLNWTKLESFRIIDRKPFKLSKELDYPVYGMLFMLSESIEYRYVKLHAVFGQLRSISEIELGISEIRPLYDPETITVSTEIQKYTSITKITPSTAEYVTENPISPDTNNGNSANEAME